MKWFSMGAPFSYACISTPQAPVPVGQPCAWCEEGITLDDCGYLIPHMEAPLIDWGNDTAECLMRERAYHVECWQRQLIGSVAHIEHACPCFGGSADEGDPPQMTKREAAHAAVVAFTVLRTDEGI